VLRSANIQPLTNVNFEVRTGATIPASVTTLQDCPPTLLSLVTGIRECKVVLVNNRYVIVEPSTRRIVTVIER
jgi:hypothetical protein